MTDFDKNTTDAWYDGNIQKICSVSASMLTAEFNRQRIVRTMGIESGDKYKKMKLATFDCRVFTIPDRIEVMNYFRARQQDCMRNSLSMVAQSHFSHTKLDGKNQSDMHDMLHAEGINWSTDYSNTEKNGQIILKEEIEGDIIDSVPVIRKRWLNYGAWVFSKDEGKLLDMIPTYE